MRILLSVLAILAALDNACPKGAQAEPATPDSTVWAPDSAAAVRDSSGVPADSAAGVRLITLNLEKGEQTLVARVEYWTRDHVLVDRDRAR